MKIQTNASKVVVLCMDLFASAVASLFAVLITRLIKDQIFGFQAHAWAWIGSGVVASLLAFLLMGTHNVIIRHSTYRSLLKVTEAVVIKELILMVLMLAGVIGFPSQLVNWGLLLFDFVLTSVFLFFLRMMVTMVLDTARHSPDAEIGKQGVMVYGTGSNAVSMLRSLENSPFYNVNGFVTRDKGRDGMIALDKKVYYVENDLDVQRLKVAYGLECLLFAYGDERADQALVELCIANGVNVLVSPRVTRIDKADEVPVPGHKVEASEVGFIADGMSPVGRLLKRWADAFASFVLLVVFSPLILICFIALKLSDKGPAFYKQERIGRLGKPFYIYKFRSMRLDAEAMGPQLLQNGEQDPRLTKVGRFLRAHHLDELPQLYNVLRGDMAFIGPRPERKFFIDQIMEKDPRYEYLFQIRPGVTSYATLYNGYTDTVEKMLRRLEYDLYYLRHRSWSFDIRILFMTFMSIVFGKKF